MKNAKSITSRKADNKGLDYAFLREEGIAYLQDLSSAIWTDFNEHDPGVTILEQLCYALTDLSYRCDIPLQDLLANQINGTIDTHRQALFIPCKIFPCNAFTEDDYRKLLYDRISKLGNVWFNPLLFDDLEDQTNADIMGLYDIDLYIPSWSNTNIEEIKKKAKELYCSHRNLCEDYQNINVIELNSVSLYGNISINSSHSPEKALAQIFFEVGDYFAPGIKRTSLETLMTLGIRSDEIFDGPLMENGFIDSSQLHPKPEIYSIYEITKKIMDVPGVLRASDLMIKKGLNELKFPIKVKKNQLLDLITDFSTAEESFPLKVFRNGIEYNPNRCLVERELKKLRNRFFQTYPLRLEYEKFFSVPKGQSLEVKEYYSIQNQFPNTYGIGHYGLPCDAPLERKGQAKQLKGYLLVFEQLLADFFSQLNHVKDLFSIASDLENTYFFQYLNESVPNVKALLKNGGEGGAPGLSDCVGYKAGLKDLVHSQDPYLNRRNRFLDFLLALYGEEVLPDSVNSYSCFAKSMEERERDLIVAKTRLLNHLVVASRDRGKAFDYLKAWGDKNIAGMLVKIRILLGMPPYANYMISDALAKYGVKASGGANSPIRKEEDPLVDSSYIEKNSLSIDTGSMADECSGISEKDVLNKSGIFNLRNLNTCFLCYGENVENYRIVKSRCEKYYIVYFVCPLTSGKYQKLFEFYKFLEACWFVLLVIKIIKEIKKGIENIFVLELNLLRHYDGGDQSVFNINEEMCLENNQRAIELKLGYSIAVVYSFCPCSKEKNTEYRGFVEQTVLSNTPAHVKAYIIQLNPHQMLIFEMIHKDWIKEMGQQKRDSNRMAAASRKILSFLKET